MTAPSELVAGLATAGGPRPTGAQSRGEQARRARRSTGGRPGGRDPRQVRPSRRAGQQHRHTARPQARADERRGMGRPGRRRPERRFPLHPSYFPDHETAPVGAGPFGFVDLMARQFRPGQLCRRQGPRQSPGAEAGPPRGRRGGRPLPVLAGGGVRDRCRPLGGRRCRYRQCAAMSRSSRLRLSRPGPTCPRRSPWRVR